MLAMTVPPLSAPIFMAPLAGMMFVLGAICHQSAGGFWRDYDGGPAWFGGTVAGMALQIGAVVILFSL